MTPHDHADEDPRETPSTGFLPISLALALFIPGLFVLGLVPGVQCQSEAAANDVP